MRTILLKVLFFNFIQFSICETGEINSELLHPLVKKLDDLYREMSKLYQVDLDGYMELVKGHPDIHMEVFVKGMKVMEANGYDEYRQTMESIHLSVQKQPDTVITHLKAPSKYTIHKDGHVSIEIQYRNEGVPKTNPEAEPSFQQSGTVTSHWFPMVEGSMDTKDWKIKNYNVNILEIGPDFEKKMGGEETGEINSELLHPLVKKLDDLCRGMSKLFQDDFDGYMELIKGHPDIHMEIIVKGMKVTEANGYDEYRQTLKSLLLSVQKKPYKVITHYKAPSKYTIHKDGHVSIEIQYRNEGVPKTNPEAEPSFQQSGTVTSHWFPMVEGSLDTKDWKIKTYTVNVLEICPDFEKNMGGEETGEINSELLHPLVKKLDELGRDRMSKVEKFDLDGYMEAAKGHPDIHMEMIVKGKKVMEANGYDEYRQTMKFYFLSLQKDTQIISKHHTGPSKYTIHNDGHVSIQIQYRADGVSKTNPEAEPSFKSSGTVTTHWFPMVEGSMDIKDWKIKTHIVNILETGPDFGNSMGGEDCGSRCSLDELATG